MRTESDYGYKYAEENDGDEGFTGPVDIEEMVNSTQSIPDGDYTSMVAAGIENPNAREYWKGFNSFFA